MIGCSGLISNCFFSGHVAEGRAVSQCLRLHDSFHVRRPSVLRSDDTARRRHKTVGNDDLFDFFVENVLDDFAETLELRLELPEDEDEKKRREELKAQFE